ncbi:MAG: glycosyltransferase [Prevotellaceae bacterium]|jgi:glycosyltransferase involved in cell wall biosynthesis|nr:glycosyltransferase [Prevotellaceae bacterium]
MPTISIITVTYNAEKTLRRTVESVLQQAALKNIEYIIVDGASADSTLKQVEDLKSKIPNFKCVSERDKGLYDAMNKGLKLATGDYILFLNAGDVLYESATVEKILVQASAEKELPDVIYGETDIVDDKGQFISHRRLKAPEKLTWKSFKMGMLVSHQAFIAKREIAPSYDLQYRYSADVDWCIRCLKSAKNILNTHLTLCSYLSEGVTTANRKASLKERFSIMSNYYGYMPTLLRHMWFAVRFYTSKILGKQL